MNQLTIHEGNTGILRFGNGDRVVPSYDIETAWDLTLKFMNLTDDEGTPLKDYFLHDGFEGTYPMAEYGSLCIRYP